MGHFIPNQKLSVLGCPLVICCLQCPMSEALLPHVLCTREYLLTVHMWDMSTVNYVCSMASTQAII